MSSTNINRVTITGNLTRDPELRTTQSGTSVCSLRIASNTRRKVGDEWVAKANYFDITVWGTYGENCNRFLAKGHPVAISGRLEWREWEAQDGTKRQSVEIVADTVEFLGAPERTATDGAAAAERSTVTEPVPVPAGVDEEDIPF